MYRVAITIVMLMQGIYEMEGSQRTNIIIDEKDGKSFQMTNEEVVETNFIISQNIGRGDKISVQLDVNFVAPLASNRTLKIALIQGSDVISEMDHHLVLEGTSSEKISIDVNFSLTGKIESSVRVNGFPEPVKMYEPMDGRFHIGITEGMERGDAIKITGGTRNDFVVPVFLSLAKPFEVIEKGKENPIKKTLPPSDEKKREKQKTTDVSNRGADQGKDDLRNRKDNGDDGNDKNAPSSDVSKSGPSMIAAIIVVIFVFVMN